MYRMPSSCHDAKHIVSAQFMYISKISTFIGLGTFCHIVFCSSIKFIGTDIAVRKLAYLYLCE